MHSSRLLLLALLFFPVLRGNAAEAPPDRAFPAAQGFGAFTSAGRGGRVLRVTTLAAGGKGSLAEALGAKGPRIVVFEVGGVIDLAGRSLAIKEPFVTVAGQTAPSPGITLIKGGLQISTHDVVVQHLRVRPGEAGRAKKSGWEVDGIAAIGASRVLIDHCSATWATDENLSPSGPRFEGASPDDWRRNTSHDITISYCLIAEGLSQSSHRKGEHSKGSLLHDNTSAIAVIGNLYASNVERNPLAKGGVHAVIVNNWITNPGRRAIHHILSASEWKGHTPLPSRLAIVGNVLEYGPDTPAQMPLFFNHGESPLDLFMADNLAFDATRKPAPLVGGKVPPLLEKRPLWPDGFDPIAAEKVKAHLAENVGARPWDRDPIDTRIIRAALDGTGKIIDSETAVGGYPTAVPTHAPFVPEDWDLATMGSRRPYR